MAYQLNLIDETLLPVAVRPSVATVLVLSAACVLAGTGHLAYERSQFARSLAQPQADDVALDAESGPEAAFDTRLVQLQRDERLRDALAGFRDLPLDTAQRLQQLSAALPDQLWLTEVEFSGSRGVRVAGGALDPSALSAYAARLSQVPVFSGLPLQAVTVEPTRVDAAQAEGGDAAAAATAPARAPHHQFVLTSGQLAGGDEGAR